VSDVTLDGISVGSSHYPYTIAELGHNHMGDIREAKKLMVVAQAAGVQAVKLQRRDNHALYTERFYNSPYGGENSYADTYGPIEITWSLVSETISNCKTTQINLGLHLSPRHSIYLAWSSYRS